MHARARAHAHTLTLFLSQVKIPYTSDEFNEVKDKFRQAIADALSAPGMTLSPTYTQVRHTHKVTHTHKSHIHKEGIHTKSHMHTHTEPHMHTHTEPASPAS
jgi:hypothetical protein